MGNANSQEATETQTVNYTHGHHVIKITPGSPGDKGGLIPFFDYLVEANGVLLDKDSILVEILTQSVGKELKFIVYNTKKEDIREVVIKPSDWGEQTRLGVSVRFAELKPNMMDYVWHVLEVSLNSPASDAGLIADHDYIVGTTSSGFTDSDDFYTLIDRNHHKPIELYVYNVAADQVRTVILTPNPSWGGSGSLGCDVGYGFIHRIPSEESRRKLLGVSDDTPLKRHVIRQSNSPPPSPQPISQNPSPLQSQYQPPIQPSFQPSIQPSIQPQSPVQSPVQLPVQSPVQSLVQHPVVPVQSLAQSPVPSLAQSSIQSPVGQSPVNQSPIVQSPIQSPLVQSPIGQSPVVQSPVNQSPISSPITPLHSQLPSTPLSNANQSQISISTPLPTTPLASQNFPSPVPSPLSPSISIQSPSPPPLSPLVPTTPVNFPPSPYPSTPITLPANSPSLETLQALKDKQAKLQEHLKSLQSQS